MSPTSISGDGTFLGGRIIQDESCSEQLDEVEAGKWYICKNLSSKTLCRADVFSNVV